MKFQSDRILFFISPADEEEWANYYIDDFVNHPDVVKHPAFPILTRRALEFKNSLEKQGFTSRQGPFGAISGLLLDQGPVRQIKTISFHLYFLLWKQWGK